MNIYLMGYMGCGKSSTGKALAKKLNMAFVDMDDLIEQAEKIKIETIFKEQGEEKFRVLERHYLNTTTAYKNTVIALGGGTPCYFDNVKTIQQNGISIYLQMNALALVNRLMHAKTERPLIKNKTNEELLLLVEKTLDEREKFYQQATYTINAINLDIDKLIATLKRTSIENTSGL